MNMDLRSFIGEARQLGPEYFVSISKPVDPVLETCVIQQKLAADGRFPAIRMENIKGAELPLATNILGSYSLLGLALGVDPGQPKSAILKRFRDRAATPLEPQPACIVTRFREKTSSAACSTRPTMPAISIAAARS